MPDFGPRFHPGRRIYTYSAWIWALIIFVLSVTPGREFPEVHLWEADKFIHIAIYLLLAWLLCMSKQHPNLNNRYRTAGLALLAAGIFGSVIEVIQGAWISERYFDVLDILANIIGSFTGVTIYWLFINRVKL